jgi:hypothetical protein
VAADAPVNFVHVEIQTGFVMLYVARSKRDRWDLDGAARVIAHARNALDSAKRFLPALNKVSGEALDELRFGISELESAIQRYDNGPTTIF